MNQNENHNPPKTAGNRSLIGFGTATVICFTIIIILGLLTMAYLLKNLNPIGKKNTTELFDNTELLEKLANLELASRTTNETVEKIEQTIINIPYLGSAASEADYKISFMVKYVYFVSAERSGWQFKEEDGIAYVKAPMLQSGEPSVFTESIKGEYKGGVFVLNEKGKLEDMKKAISAYARNKGSSSKSIDIVRETARKSLEHFIFDWFAKSDVMIKAVNIVFADENVDADEGKKNL